jgi:hypothetical protein
MTNPSPRRPRFSGTGLAVLIGLLAVLVLAAIGFAVWGAVIYPATPTDTPRPLVGTLTAIAEAVGSPPVQKTAAPSPTAAVTEADAPSPTAADTATTVGPTATQPAETRPTATEPATSTPTPVAGTPAAGETQTPTEPSPPTDTPPPPTATPRPANLNTFGYGIQSHMIGVGHEDTINAIHDLGFQWLKQQIEWKKFEKAKGEYDWAEIDRLVQSCAEGGVYLLVSVVKAPDWARGPNFDPDPAINGPPADPQDLADFVGAMAARYKGRIHAYEVWNEQNLHYEWGNEPLDAARYVRLLEASRNAIKAADPGALVISGALTPAGTVPGPDGRLLAVEDRTYLQQMYDAGLKGKCDGVGVHPSGYNIPPDVDWQSYQDPSAQFRGLWDSPHYSWSFKGVMETYRQTMVQNGDANTPLWVTEFGWAVESDPPPNYEYAADNTLQEQRDWTVQAYQMGKSWGWVGPMFLWNLNFRQIVPWSEQGMWTIRTYEGDPLPVYVALRDMPK